MLKKTIKYTDFDGNEREEDAYFNLSKAELMEMEFSERGGLENYLQEMIKAENTKKLFAFFKEIVLNSYGQKSFDGKHFIKKRMQDGEVIRLRDEFEQTEGYTELMMELMTGGETAMAEFITAIIPKDLAEQVKAEQAKQLTN